MFKYVLFLGFKNLLEILLFFFFKLSVNVNFFNGLLTGIYEGVSKSSCTNAITFYGIRYHTKLLSCVKSICV